MFILSICLFILPGGCGRKTGLAAGPFRLRRIAFMAKSGRKALSPFVPILLYDFNRYEKPAEDRRRRRACSKRCAIGAGEPVSTLGPEFISIPAPETTNLHPHRQIGELWRRVLAGFIDFVILGIIGHLVAWPFSTTLIALGPVAPLVGYFIGMLYFAVPESSIGHGASLGKRLLLLQVVHADGSLLTIEESLIRYTLFSVPIFLGDSPLPLSRTPWAVICLKAFVSIGLGVFTDYLIIFNRNTRQGVHDLSVKSFVAQADRTGIVSVGKIWTLHWLIAAALVFILAEVASLLGVAMPQMGAFRQIMNDYRLVEQVDGVQSANIMASSLYDSSRGWKTQVLVVMIHCNCQESAEEYVADEAAIALLRGDPHVPEFQKISIVVLRGYNIGIASSITSEHYSDTPDGWSMRLLGVPLATGSPSP
jgi:uncharacterized RDD family membrane protein YckC